MIIRKFLKLPGYLLRRLGDLRGLVYGALVLVLAGSMAYFVVWPLFVENQNKAKAEAAGTNTIDPALVVGSPNGLQPLPELPPNVASDPEACDTYLGAEWGSKISPAIVNFAMFPSQAPVESQLADIQPLVTKPFYEMLARSWQASTTPRFLSESAEVTQCRLGQTMGPSRQIKVLVSLTSINDSGNQFLDVLPYDVYVVMQSNGFAVANILPAGSVYQAPEEVIYDANAGP